MDIALYLVIRSVIGVVLLGAGVSKLLMGRAWRIRQIGETQLFPKAVIPAVASVLPVLEIVVGLLAIAAPGARGYPLGASAALFLTFTAIVVISLVRDNRHGGCGCFGTEKESASWTLVGRNVSLAGLSAVGIFVHPPVSFTQAAAADALILAVLGMMLYRLNRAKKTASERERTFLEPLEEWERSFPAP